MWFMSRCCCQSPVHRPLRNCKEISIVFMYNIQSVTVLDVVVLESTNSLSIDMVIINMVIISACIVNDVLFSCVPFTSSFKICKKLLIINFLSLQGFPTNVCARVTLDIYLPCNMAFMLPSAYINSNSAYNLDPCILYSVEQIKLIIH